MKTINSYSFLTIGKTKESAEQQEFKKYIGLASSYIIAVNPNKKELEEIYGNTQDNEPEYVKEDDNGKYVNITFITKTVPELNNGIEIISRLMFTLRAEADYTRDGKKVRIIDVYGNTARAFVEDAKAGKVILTENGNPAKIDTKYRMACVGEADLIGFLKTYLRVEDAFDYINGVWTKKPNADRDCKFALDHVKDYFKGDFSELREALALQPNNKVKLLYGVRTADTENGPRQYQAVAARADFILANNAGDKAIAKLERNLANAKQNGAYSSTDFKVCELTEWEVAPTNLEKPAEDPLGDSSDLPWM